MSAPPAPGSGFADKIFTTFTNDQGANYAEIRPKYHPNLYKTVVDRHTSTGGQLGTVLDVGCGPGTAARALAPQFAHAIGLDPSEGMMANARVLGGTSSSSEPIRFEVSSAEELGSNLSPPVQDSSVDLITAATAAHWFDMERFWPSAARVLKPGGTVAIWSTGSVHVHASVPNGVAIQAAIDDIEERYLVPFYEKGNLLTRSLYEGLPLPWTVEPPMADFDEASFFRKEWDYDSSEDFFASGEMSMDLDMMERLLGTSSPVARWRAAHPEDVGTERDVIRLIRAETARLMHEAGVEKGKEVVKGSLKGVLLIVKKKA
ncbi:methyltransferase [Thelonectria olida]|uniref:Methyltransferase n=1 Tax=Thelonectria olida TaxID=1576542 RepID=A0A9P8W107_9HYPO|nr:methyltransferase [Thelonectria olida]